jgi:hypothetical protein
LHRGVEFLSAARAPTVLVGLNSDHPAHYQGPAALSSPRTIAPRIAAVCHRCCQIFDEPTPAGESGTGPMFGQGGDWPVDQIVGADTVGAAAAGLSLPLRAGIQPPRRSRVCFRMHAPSVPAP